MPGGAVFQNAKGEEKFFYQEDFAKAQAAGWKPRAGERVLVHDDAGEATVASEDLPGYLEQAHGSGVASQESADQAYGERIDEATYGGAGGAAATFLAGAGRGLTLGLSDEALVRLGVDPSELAALRRVNPGANLAGEIAGAAAPALFGDEAGIGALLAKSPAGLVSRGGRAIAGLGEGAGLAGRTIAAGAAGAAEGGAFGGGQALSDAVIEDKPLTAEAFVASVGSGALYGGAFGAGAELAGEAASAVARGVKKIAGKAEEAATGLAKRAEAAASRKAQTADDLLAPGPKAATAEEVGTLIKAGDSVTDEAWKALASRDVSNPRKAVISSRLTALEDAQKAIGAGESASAEAAARAAGEAPPEAITAYHAALEGLAGDLKKVGVELKVPPNPAVRVRVEGGAVASVGELVPDAGAAARASMRSEVKAAVQQLDTMGSPVLEEARRVVAAQQPVESAVVGGQTFQELLGGIEGSAKLAGLVKNAESAQAAFQKAWGVGTVASRQTEMFAQGGADAVEALMAASPADFTKAVRTLQSYDDSVRKLAAELDVVAPNAAAPPRVQQLGQAAIARTTKAPPLAQTGFDAGDILALADLAGLDIEDVPVIGQIPAMGAILKARLAYRRLKGGLGKVRLAGASAKVGGIAARGQQIRTGLERAVKQFVSAAAPKARRFVPPAAATVLHDVSFGGEPPAKETKQEAFARIAEELQTAAGDKARLDAHLKKKLDLDIPELVDPILEAAHRKIAYLTSTIPKDPREPSLLRSTWQPDDLELDEFAERVWAAENPLGVLSQMGAGRLTPASAETLREVYPALFGQLQAELVREIGERQTDMPHDRQVQLSVLLDLPVSATEEPSFVAAMQEGYAAKQPGPKPGENVRMQGLDKMKFQPPAAEASALL